MRKKVKLVEDFFHSEVDNYKKEFYESGYRSFMSVRLERFLEEIIALKLPVSASVLDAGCGPGYMTKAFVKLNLKTTALDSSPEMLRLTRDLFNESDKYNIPTILEGDIENLPFADNSFDLIASAGVLEYLANDKRVFNEFRRVLKPDGYLILSSTNKFSPIGLFDPIVEAIKRNTLTRKTCNKLLKIIGGTPIRARDFIVRKHSSSEFCSSAKNSNFEVIKRGYFYALPWPHPLDRLFPKASNYLGKAFEPLRKTPLRGMLEGIYIVAKNNKK